MSSVAIVTDSNSGISQAEGKELGIYVIPMPCLVDGKLYYENVDITKEQFYHFLESDADRLLPSRHRGCHGSVG